MFTGHSRETSWAKQSREEREEMNFTHFVTMSLPERNKRLGNKKQRRVSWRDEWWNNCLFSSAYFPHWKIESERETKREVKIKKKRLLQTFDISLVASFLSEDNKRKMIKVSKDLEEERNNHEQTQLRTSQGEEERWQWIERILLLQV